MNTQIKRLLEQSGLQPYYDAQKGHIEKFAELVWKAAYEEGHDVGVDAGFEAGRNASFTEKNFGVEE